MWDSHRCRQIAGSKPAGHIPPILRNEIFGLTAQNNQKNERNADESLPHLAILNNHLLVPVFIQTHQLKSTQLFNPYDKAYWSHYHPAGSAAAQSHFLYQWGRTILKWNHSILLHALPPTAPRCFISGQKRISACDIGSPSRRRPRLLRSRHARTEEDDAVG